MTQHVSKEPPATPFARLAPNELTKRVISAMVLGVMAIGAAVGGAWPLAVMVSIGAIVLAWEWGRLVRNSEFDDTMYVHVATLLIAIALAAGELMDYALITLFCGFVAIAIRRSREYRKLSALGVLYIGLAAIGVVWLRLDDWGLAAILLIFACVWAHDTIAMVIGRALGGPRLWPTVSPRKTWSGAVAGLSASMVVASAAYVFLPNTNLAWLAALGLVLGVAALFGDLAASSLKRLGRVKNASGLIPGHGGFLDRLDGAIASFLIACLIALSIDAGHPATALLQGP